MNKQLIDFQQNGDSGYRVPESIAPIEDGEDANQATLGRPDENLRLRTEVLRGEVESLKYLADMDRALLLEGGGAIAFDGSKFTLGSTLTLKPFLAPSTTTPARLDIGGILFETRTAVFNGVNPLRAYGRFGGTIPGANEYSVAVEVVGGTPNPVLSVGPTGDARHWVLTVGAQHTIQDAYAYLTGAAGAGSALEEFQKRYAITRVAGTAGYPKIPSDIIASFAPTYFTGALDAEVHYLTALNVQGFFASPGNAMGEGDVLCLRYDDLIMGSGGGRRQSIGEQPEQDKATIPAGSMFLLRNHPEWVAYALPIARVFGGNLIFVNGRVYGPGETGELLDRVGTVRHHASGQTVIGGVDPANGDTARAVLSGVSGSNSKQGLLRLYDDGAAPQDLTYARLATLVGGGDAGALHSHTQLLMRWMCDDAGSPVQGAANGATSKVCEFEFDTTKPGQIVECAFELMVHLNPGANDNVFSWELWLDTNTKIAFGNVPDVDATGAGGDGVEAGSADGVDQPFNDMPWVSIPAAGHHKLELKVKVDGTGYSLKASKAKLS